MALSPSFFKRSLAAALAATSVTMAVTNAFATTTNLVNFSNSGWNGKSTSLGSFGAGYGADFTVDVVDGALKGEASGNASIELFGETVSLVDLSASANINDSSSDGANITAEFVGATIYEKSFADGFVFDASTDLSNYDDTFCATFFDVSTTFTIVVVPVTMAAGAEGCANLTFSATPQYNTTTHQGTLNLALTPELDVDLTASVGVGSSALSAGVEANVTLLDFSLPITLNPIYNFNTKSFTYGTTGTIDLNMLDGSLDVYAKVHFLFWDKKYSYTIFDWDGISNSWTLWAVGKPSASNVTLTMTGQSAATSYTYSDTANLSEGISKINWYRNSTASDTGRTDLGYTLACPTCSNSRPLVDADNGQYLKACVTPINSNYTSGDQACSEWTSVGKLAQFYPNSSFGDYWGSTYGHAAIPYENSSYGTCFNMSNYTATADFIGSLSMDNQTSSMKLYAPANSSAVFHFYKSANCADSTTSSNYARISVAAGSSSLQSSTSALGSDWDDQISSFMVTLDEVVTATSTSVSFSGNTATGSYVFNVENNTIDSTESGSTYVWYRAIDSSGTGSTAISGATSSTYTLTPADDLKYLKFCVTPSNGYTTGTQSCSSWTAVAHMLKFWDGTNYAGSNIAIPWEKSEREKCFNMSDYGFNDKASSYKWNNNTVANSTVWLYRDANCTGTVATRTLTTNGSESLTSIGATMGGAWDNSISSFKVSWNSPITISTPALSITGNTATESHTYSGGFTESATYTWYRASDSSGTGAAAIDTFNSNIYTLTGDDNKKYLRVCVLSSNGVVVDESTYCSNWTSVGGLARLYSGDGETGMNINLAYQNSASNTCFKMSDYGFDSLLSSATTYGPSSGTAFLLMYSNTNCSGTAIGYFGADANLTMTTDIGSDLEVSAIKYVLMP